MLINRLVAYSALGILMSVPAFAGSLTFTSIEYNSTTLCGGICSFGTTFGYVGVNDSNEVVTSFAAGPTAYYGYTYQGGTYSSPIQANAGTTVFSGVSDSGEITGYGAVSGALGGFTDTGGTFSSYLKFPTGLCFSDGYPNPFPAACGSYTVSSTFMNGIQSDYNGALGAVAPLSVGFFSAGSSTTAFVYNPASTATTGPFSPVLCAATATTSNLYSINDSGEAVGYCKSGTGPSGSIQQAFIYDADTPNTAPTILSSSSLATALGDTVNAVFLTSVDDSGDLAGYYSGGANGQTNGFYCKGDYAFSSCSVLDVPQVSAFNQSATVDGTEIMGINNEGSVVGVYEESSGAFYAFLATTTTTTTTPEPGTLILTGGSILGLAAFRLRRKALRA